MLASDMPMELILQDGLIIGADGLLTDPQGLVVTQSFPFHRCSDYSNSSLPYVFSEPVEKQPGLYCMVMTYIGPKDDKSICYGNLENSLTTITLGVSECCF
jgi:hypothetical protein